MPPTLEEELPISVNVSWKCANRLTQRCVLSWLQLQSSWQPGSAMAGEIPVVKKEPQDSKDCAKTPFLLYS